MVGLRDSARTEGFDYAHAVDIDLESRGTYYLWVAGWGPDDAGNAVTVGVGGSPGATG